MGEEHSALDCYVCPQCRGQLRAEPGVLRCTACRSDFPVENQIADFSGGAYYDSFDPRSTDLSSDHLLALEDEVCGTHARVADFYLPRLKALGSTLRAAAPPLRVLDCGCGNGLSVDMLTASGFASWGNDVSMLRRWQWRERTHRDRLSVAGGSALPFPDGFFDVVICSGVLEHVGVTETSGASYSVMPLPQKSELRSQFLAELLRVTRCTGRIWLDFPNGAFPVDFWHGTFTHGMRWHPLKEGFLPTLGEIEEHVRLLTDQRWVVRGVSPHGRLHFRRIRRHWYGKVFLLPVKALFWSMRLPVGRLFAGSALNPYLVLEICATGSTR